MKKLVYLGLFFAAGFIFLGCSPKFTITSAYPTYMCSGQQITINFTCEYVRELRLFGKDDKLLAEKTGMDDSGYTGSISTDNGISPDDLTPKENTFGCWTLKGVGSRKGKSASYDYDVYFVDEMNPIILSVAPSQYDKTPPETHDEEDKNLDHWRVTSVIINKAWWNIDSQLFSGCVKINKIHNNSPHQIKLTTGIPLKGNQTISAQAEILNKRDNFNDPMDPLTDTNPGGTWGAELDPGCQIITKKVKLIPTYDPNDHMKFIGWEESANVTTHDAVIDDMKLDFYLLGWN